MRHFLITTAAFLTCTLFDNSLFAQVDTNSISSINSFIKNIDSLIENDSEQKFIMTWIEEGKISKEILKTRRVRLNKRVDTVKNKIWGGWSKYRYENVKHDTLYKIEYHDNLEKNFYLTFYYKDNHLVFSRLEYQENGIGQTFYKREEYYKGNNIIFLSETKDKVDEEFQRRIEENLYKRGNDYFQEFLKDK